MASTKLETPMSDEEQEKREASYMQGFRGGLLTVLRSTVKELRVRSEIPPTAE